MKLSDVHHKKILISPLNWGMGHVSRCIGLLDQLLKQENNITIACNEDQKAIFLDYFPNLNYIDHSGYPFKFRGRGKFGLDLFFRLPSLFQRLRNEQKEVSTYVELYQIDLVLSDHRYGFYAVKCPSVFITHQLKLSLSWVQAPFQRIHNRLLKKFQWIWIMDTKDSPLAGKLSRANGWGNTFYIGHFSRFSRYEQQPKKYDRAVVVSGPEPYAGHFYLKEWEKGMALDIKSIYICPKAYGTKGMNNPDQDIVVGSWIEKDIAILQSKKIVSRAGYSTLMDLKVLDVSAELSPTPGQSEQVYLSELYNGGIVWDKKNRN